MAETLGVASSRGVVRFVAVKEEDLATGGMTVAGEIETLAHGARESGEGERAGRKAEVRKRSRSRRREKVEKVEKAEEKSRPPTRDQAGERAPPFPPVPGVGEKSASIIKPEKVQKVGRRRSFLAFLGR